MPPQNHLLGILFSFLGYSAWVVGDVSLKLAGDGLSLAAILVINLGFSLVFTLVMTAQRGGLRQLHTKRPGFHALRSLLWTISVYGNVAGVIALPLADFYTIIFTSPLIMAVLGHFFLKERADAKIWLASLFGFLGVIFAVRFSSMGATPASWEGVLLTALSALTMALAMLMARAGRGENSYALSFWPMLVNLLVALPWLVWEGGIALDWNAIFFAALSGAVGGVGALLTNASLRLAPAAIVAPYHYTQIVGGMIFGYLIWRHIPEPSVVAGSAMIAAAGLYILHAEHRRGRTA